MHEDSDSNEVASPIAAVFPCGVARQIRVQFRSSPALGWRRFGVYSRRGEAEACAARLQAGGYAARVLDFRVAPVAG